MGATTINWAELSERFAQWLCADDKCSGRRSGDRVDGHCPRPAHEDDDPSFSYYVEKAGWACSCGKGKASELIKELGIDLGVIVEQVTPSVVATYAYKDEHGEVLYEIQRLIPKSFRQRAKDPKTGEWREGKGAMDGVRRLPYRLPQIKALEKGTLLLIVDGEKDVEAAWKLGVPATCISGGMANWGIRQVQDVGAGLRVSVVADKDKDGKGRKDAQRVRDLFSQIGVHANVTEMPGPANVKDLSDWVQAGGTVSEIEGIASNRERWEDIARSPIVPMSELTHLIDAQVDYSIRPICPKGSLIIVQGPPKSGKSVFCTYLGGCAALGIFPAGAFHVEQSMKVLLVEYEDAPLLVVKRLSRYISGMGLDARALPENLLFCDYPDLWLDSQRHKDLLIEEIKARGIGMVILDTLSYVHQAEDENSAADMKPVMANLKRIAKESNASIVLVHHAGKGSKDKSISERGRGSSVIAAAADVILDWGDRKKTNKTPVEFISKFDDGFEFEVEYSPMTDGAVQWKVITEREQQEEKRTRKDEIVDKIKQMTLADPKGFTLEALLASLKHISEQIVYREVRNIERDGQLWVSKAGHGGAKIIRFIDKSAQETNNE